uniref:Nanos-type domain-containing protein n=1 Tax=Caenorhabditis japonica TaxID=281687 RepID=A0A8R1HQE7_CAEJA
MNTYGVPPGAPPPHAAAMMQQQHHQHMSQTGAYHQFVPIPPQSQQPQRRPGQVEPLMGGPPAFISGSPGRGGYQGGGGQMHSQHPQHMNANANPMQQPMGYFQVPATSGGPPRGGRGGRGRGGGHFHSRQNSNQSYHSSASYSTPRGAYDQNSHMYHQSPPMEQQTHEEEVAGLSNRIEHLQPVSASSRAGSPSKQMLQLVESKVESPEPEDIGGGFATAQVLDNVKKSGKKNRKEQKQKEQQKLTEEPKGEPVKADEVVKKDEEVEAKVVEKEAEEEEESSKEVEDKSENHCYHCAYYNKPTEEISSHNIRKPNGDLWCEDLQKQKCQHCEATGEKGHHHLICPKKKEEEKAEKSSLKTHNPPDAPALQESDKEPLASPREDEDDEDDAELNKKPSQHQKSRQNSETSRGGGRYHQYDKNYYNNNGGGRGRGRGSGGRGGYAPRGNVRGNFENRKH